MKRQHGSLQRGWLLGLAMALTGCATPAVLPPAEGLFHDALFTPPTMSLQAEAAFALSPEMRQYAERTLRPRMQDEMPELALVNALQDRGLLQLEYDAASTRTAAEAFSARAGNCLALVMMTGSFAEYFGIGVQYQEVFVAPTWSRASTLEMATRHINLRLLPTNRHISVATTGDSATRTSPRDSSEALTVDFLPAVQAERYRSRVISRDTVKAMYWNNRAAERLAEGDTNNAYWFARESIRTVPAFTDAYNLLGVIYQQHGNPAQAAFVLRQALALEPDKALVMSNLANALEATGHPGEALALRQRLARIEPTPPFYFYDQGVAALRARRYAEAARLFRQELRRESNDADCYLGLALAELYQQRWGEAKRALVSALERSTTSKSRALYAAKLDWLNARGYERPKPSPQDDG